MNRSNLLIITVMVAIIGVWFLVPPRPCGGQRACRGNQNALHLRHAPQVIQDHPGTARSAG